jgi:hypothetical protein
MPLSLNPQVTPGRVAQPGFRLKGTSQWVPLDAVVLWTIRYEEPETAAAVTAWFTER